MIQLFYFAQLREEMGKDTENLSLDHGQTPEELLTFLFADEIKRQSIRRYYRVAVNEEYTDFDHKLKEGDEIALIPPVAGG